MRKKINHLFLKNLKAKKLLSPSNLPFSQVLNHKVAKLICQTIQDIKKPFHNICIHSNSSLQIAKYLVSRCQKYNQTSHMFKIKIADEFGGNIQVQQLKINLKSQRIQFERDQSPKQGIWNSKGQQYDLIISDLQWHICQNPQNLLKGYLDSLKEDGALVGCCYGQSTLRQLYWSYIMAENQRSGGISPKVATFPSLGTLGNILTSSHFHLSTIFTIEQVLKFESVVDLLSVIQQIGESGYLQGRRLGVYKQVLLAMSAIYESQFSKLSESNQKYIESSLEFLNFIGWKYSSTQTKPLRRGQKTSVSFIDELKGIDSQLKHYKINETDDQPQQIK